MRDREKERGREREREREGNRERELGGHGPCGCCHGEGGDEEAEL